MFDEPREPDSELIMNELACGHRKHLCIDVSKTPCVLGVVPLTVQLLQCQSLGLSDEAEDHNPGNEVQASVESD